MTSTEPRPRALRRKRILETSLKVFANAGYGQTDVQVIANLAGVGKGTIYRHFENKEKLFLAAARYAVERLGEYLAANVSTDGHALEYLRRLALGCARYYELHPETVEIMIQERAWFREVVFPTHLNYRAENRAAFEERMLDAIRAGEIREVDVGQLCNAFCDLVFGTVVNGCLEGSQGRLLERMQGVIDVLLNGLAVHSHQGHDQAVA